MKKSIRQRTALFIVCFIAAIQFSFAQSSAEQQTDKQTH